MSTRHEIWVEVSGCSDLKEFELQRFELWCCCFPGSLSLIPIYTKFPSHKGAFKWACSEGIFQGKERAEQLSLPSLHLPWNKPLTVFLQGEMPDVALVRGAGENLWLLDLLKPFCTALLCPKNLNNYFFFFFFPVSAFIFLLLSSRFLILSPLLERQKVTSSWSSKVEAVLTCSGDVIALWIANRWLKIVCPLELLL